MVFQIKLKFPIFKMCTGSLISKENSKVKYKLDKLKNIIHIILGGFVMRSLSMFVIAGISLILSFDAKYHRQLDRSYSSFMVNMTLKTGKTDTFRSYSPDYSMDDVFLTLETSLMIQNKLVEMLEEVDIENSETTEKDDLEINNTEEDYDD